MRSTTAAATWAVLVCCWAAQSDAGVDRSQTFIGYTESDSNCQDKLNDCDTRAKSNGCIYDAFDLRQFCPTTCTVERCSYHGSLQIKHRGHATSEGTLAFKKMMTTQYEMTQDNFRAVQLNPADETLHLSALGIGTYLGETDARTDEAVVTAILSSVSHGWNVIDTGSNYRWGKAEESVGVALSAMLAGDTAAAFAPQAASQYKTTSLQSKVLDALKYEANSVMAAQLAAAAGMSVQKGDDITRDMVFISTKAGFTTPQLVDQLIKSREMTFRDVVSGMHSIHPQYIKASLNLSLERLRLDTVDLLYLHNAAEVQIPSMGRDKFMQRLLEAFRALEELRTDGKIQFYGLATWECFRKPPTDPLYLSLESVVEVAEQAAGKNHGFRFVQLPVNAAMPEAWMEPWQTVHNRNTSLIEAAKRLDVGVMTSGPLGEGGLVQSLAEHVDPVPELSSHYPTAAKLLHFARSVPGVITTLVGQKSRMNVEANLQLSLRPALDHDQFMAAARAIARSRVQAMHHQN